MTDKHVKAKRVDSGLYARAKKTNLPADWNAYKLEDKKFKRLCKHDKNKAWRNYKESIQTEKEMASLVRLAQREDRREINVLTKTDGSSTDPGEETIQLLTQTHFPAATDTVRVTYNNRRNCSSSLLAEKYINWINSSKIQEALAGFEKKKSPGPDDIRPIIFDYLPPEFIKTLEYIYKAAIHLAYTPKLWKRTKVIYIAKPGKEAYDKPKAFRPISLSNYLLKGLERLVGWHMDQALVHHPIHHKQHGFLTGKSTESAISNTVDYIEKHIMQRQHCVGVFLDISSAFDSIKPSHVRRALPDHGGDPEMVQWYYNYITHRDIEVEMHGVMSKFSTGVGFPQGGVCSAKFWLIAFDYAIKILNRFNIEGNGYADDCSALYGGPRLDHAINRLQKMLDELTAWGRTCGLRFNPEKSVAVVFTRRRKTPPRKLRIDGCEIEYKNEVTYLGIQLDSKLHWTKHITDKIGKAKKFLAGVASMTRRNWGPKPRLMRWAYLGVVRPMLCYGAMIWGHRAPELEAKLRRVNRMAMNTFGSFPASTPTRAMEIMMDIMPLHLHCQKEALAARIRLNDVVGLTWVGYNDKKTHSKSHLYHWQQILDRYQINISHSDRCSELKWAAGFRVNRDSFTGDAKHRTHTQYNAYTDGSRLNERTGSGLVIYKGKNEVHTRSVRLPDHATVFQAEIAAIALAADRLTAVPPQDINYVKIFVDSQAALLAVGNPVVKSKAVAYAINSLNKLGQIAKSVTLVWIPAHKGHFGNERADELAKFGTQIECASHAVTVGKPSSVMKSELNNHVLRDWSREWNDYGSAQHSKGFYLSPNPAKAKFVYKLARLELGRFVRIITGHNNLNYFQAHIGLGASPLCRLCGGGNETFQHLVATCPRLWRTSREFFQDKLPSNDMLWSVRALLDFSFQPGVNEAFEGTEERDFHVDPDGLESSDSTMHE